MKGKAFFVTGLVLLILAAGLTGCEGFTSPIPKASSSGDGASGQQTGIWVTGEGKVTVTPDVAVLNLGVEAQSATVAQAQSDAAAAMERVMAALAAAGVAADDIQTQYFRIRQRTRWDEANQQEIVTGYQVTNQVSAKIRDIAHVSGTIEAVVGAGGDLVRINDLGFSVDDPSIYYDEARRQATEDALAKAEKLARLNDVRLGAPTYIVESTPHPIYQDIAFIAGGARVPAPAPAPSPAVSPGEIDVSLTVQIAYGIR